MIQKFNVGDSVKVMSDDKAYDDVRDKTLTLIEWYDDGDNIVWHVDYAGKPDDEYFACWESDLATVSVKVVEGVVGSFVGRRYVGDIATDETLDGIDDGDEVRLTIEVIRKAGESK